MQKKAIEYHEIVKNIIHELTGDANIWKEISYHSIEKAAEHLEFAVDVAMQAEGT